MAERNEVGQDAERSSERIRQDIVAKRETISGTVDRLGERINEKLDWRGYVRRYPYAVLGTAAGVAFVASALILRRRRSPMEKVADSIADAVEDIRDQVLATLGGLGGHFLRSGSQSFIRRALSGAVGKAAVEMVKNMATGDGFRKSEGRYHDESGPSWTATPEHEPSSSRTLK